MSVFIDTLAQIITESISDAEATREDWQKAVDQVFGGKQTPKLSQTTTGGNATCGRHGGRWGDDETCQDCTDIDGNPRPLPHTTLDPVTAGGPFRISWQIDSDKNVTPVEAAIHSWRDTFGRSPNRPGPDEACVFIITDNASGDSIEIDLSDPQFAHFFD